MGIQNIHHLTKAQTHHMALQAQAALQEKLMKEHRQGMHPYGSMRRECPLCQASNR